MDENAKWERLRHAVHSLEASLAVALGAVALLSACAGSDGTDHTGSAGNVNAGAGFGGSGSLGAGGTATGGSGSAGSSAGAVGSGGAGGATGGNAGAGTSGGGSQNQAGTFGGVSGTGAVAGRGGNAGTGAAGGGSVTGGTCCASGDCLCHGPDPTGLTSATGPFATATFTIATGTVHYPTDAEPPFAAVALCGGFLNTGPEMEPWGPFYASHGIVTIITTTTAVDLPDVRATKLLASIAAIQAENERSGSPLLGKLAGRYGTSGYSMGGGGTTLASVTDPTLRTSVGLAAWSATGENVRVPTLLLCGASDGTAPCSMSETAYTGIAAPTPKMMVTIAGTDHFKWFGPADAGGGTSGETALAFQKVFLEGDERWRPFLLQSRGTVATNIE